MGSKRILEPEVMDGEGDVEAYADGVASAHLSRLDETFVRRALRLGPSEGALLDVGTGTGEIPIKMALRRPGLRVAGVDRSPAMLAVARRIARERSVKARFRRADARRLPYPDGAFDMVISNSLIHHLADPVPALREMARVLRPEGALFVRDLRRPRPHRIEDHIRREGRFYRGRMFELFADSVRAAFTVAEVRTLLADAGVRGVRLRPQFTLYWVIERACT